MSVRDLRDDATGMGSESIAATVVFGSKGEAAAAKEYNDVSGYSR